MQETVTASADAGETVKERVRSPAAFWMRLAGRTRVAAVIFVACLFVYTLLLILVPRYKGTTTTQGDETHYLLVAESLLRDGDVFLTNNYDARQYLPYFESETIMRHVARGRNGNLVSTHPMFLSLVVLPGFWLFGYRGAAFIMILFACGAASLSFLTADRFVNRGVAAGVTLFLFLSYPLLFYSRLIYPETPAIFLVALALWSGWRLRESGRALHAALIGLSSGLLLLFHPKYIGISVALFFLFLITRPSRERRLLVAWLVPAACAIILLLILTAVAFGPNLAGGLTASGGSKFQGGYWGTNSGWGIPGLFLDRAWGLFIFAPFYLLFLHGLALQNNALEWDRWWLFFPVCIGLQVLVLGFFQSWNGGAAPVQRYLIPLAPLFLLCIALFIDRVRSKAAYAAAGALALLQVVTTVWAFRFFVGVYGMENTDNLMLPHYLANNIVKRFLFFIFPLFHPAGGLSIAVTLAWALVLAATVYAARRFYMRHGGGKLSPVVDISPFRSS
jgi:hypothetical protein